MIDSDMQGVYYTEDYRYRIMFDSRGIYEIYKDVGNAYSFEGRFSGKCAQDALDNYYIRSLVQEMENDNAF